jgi:hypothetical protein
MALVKRDSNLESHGSAVVLEHEVEPVIGILLSVPLCPHP